MTKIRNIKTRAFHLALATLAISAPFAIPGGIVHAAADDPIAVARRAIADSPEDAAARLALARAFGEAIRENPTNGPRYAFEMLSALQAAVSLDPELADTYHYLVDYYLNAPPIAGGSVEKAEEAARALAEFDPQAGERLLGQIAGKHGGRVQIEASIRDSVLSLTVRDNGDGPDTSPHRGSGTSLSEFEERLELVYAGAAGFSVEPPREGGFEVRLTLPTRVDA